MDKYSKETVLTNVVLYFFCIFCFLGCSFYVGGLAGLFLGLAGYMLSFFNASIIYTVSNLKE